jgi:hypothetical protein
MADMILNWGKNLDFLIWLECDYAVLDFSFSFGSIAQAMPLGKDFLVVVVEDAKVAYQGGQAISATDRWNFGGRFGRWKSTVFINSKKKEFLRNFQNKIF